MKKSKYNFLYRAHDGSIMRPESFLNINKGRTLSRSQLRVLGITKIKIFRLSITLGDKAFICNNINDDDIIIKEFEHWDQANNYINNNFKKIAEGSNYNYYEKV